MITPVCSLEMSTLYGSFRFDLYAGRVISNRDVHDITRVYDPASMRTILLASYQEFWRHAINLSPGLFIMIIRWLESITRSNPKKA